MEPNDDYNPNTEDPPSKKFDKIFSTVEKSPEIDSVYSEYIKLVDLSNHFYNNLKNLSLTCDQSFWKSLFQHTFDHFTRLWKFQQENREVLEKDHDLRRFEIGEIARKIGELYYQYFLRTSDTRYLQLSYKFFEAIRHRRYFRHKNIKSLAEFFVKLKYYLKFIVVTLLQNKRVLAIRLLKELQIILSRSQKSYLKVLSERRKKMEGEIKKKGAEKTSAPKVKKKRKKLNLAEYMKIFNEINDFLESDTMISVGNNPNQITYRSSPHLVAIIDKHFSANYSTDDVDDFSYDLEDQDGKEVAPRAPRYNYIFLNQHSNTLNISKAVLVSSNRSKSIKFVNYTINLFRFSQSLEIEPFVLKPKAQDDSRMWMFIDKKKNCSKVCMVKPNFGILLKVLSAAFFETKSQSDALLLYFDLNSDKNSNFILNEKIASGTSKLIQKSDFVKNDNLFNFHECIPYSRRNLFLVIDTNSKFKIDTYVKKNILRKDTSFCCLYYCSGESEVHGNTFTYCLSNPVLFFCDFLNVKSITTEAYDKLNSMLSIAFGRVYETLVRTLDDPDMKMVKKFLYNIHTTSYILRFIFLKNVFLYYKKEAQYMGVNSLPEFREDVFF